LSQLRAQYAKDAREIFQEAASAAIQEVSRSAEPEENKSHHPSTKSDGQSEQLKIIDWSFSELPEMLEIQKGKQKFYGYPALEDCGTHCELNVYDDPELARKTHFRGMRRLCSIAHKETLKLLQKQLPGGREIGLLFMQIGTYEEIMQQILDLAIERSCLFEPLPRNPEEFKERMQVAKTKLSLIAQDIAKQALRCLELSAEIPKKLNLARSVCSPAFEDMQQQYQQLVNRQFIANTPYEQMVHIPRYLKGIVVRIEKLRANLIRDQENQRN
jgi:ATP-dependent helicase HrpA